MSHSPGDAQPWPLARQQLSQCLAEAGVQLACACFRAVVPEVGVTLAYLLDFPTSPAGFRCLGGGGGGGGGGDGGGGAGHAVAAATTVPPAVNGSWRLDCLRASDSGVTGRFHCVCACGGGGGIHHVTCAEICGGGGGGCPKPTAEGRLCELFPAPPDSLLTAPLVSGIVGLALLCVVLLIGMRLVKCKVPLYRARVRDCWLACRRLCCRYRWGFHHQQQRQQMPADAAQTTPAADVGQQLDEQLRPLGGQDRTGRGRDDEEESGA